MVQILWLLCGYSLLECNIFCPIVFFAHNSWYCFGEWAVQAKALWSKWCCHTHTVLAVQLHSDKEVMFRGILLQDSTTASIHVVWVWDHYQNAQIKKLDMCYLTTGFTDNLRTQGLATPCKLTFKSKITFNFHVFLVTCNRVPSLFSAFGDIRLGWGRNVTQQQRPLRDKR